MNTKKGFTLIEIMIVVAIIAILAAVAIPSFIAYRRTAQKNSCKSTQNTIRTAAEAYLVQHPDATGTIDISSAGTLWKEDGTGFLKVKEEPKCPDGSSKYTVTIDATTKVATVTCGHTSDDDDDNHNK